SRLLLGDVRLKRVELLTRGAIRPILSGNRFIHALFHLDRPSVTIVVRTHTDRLEDPQFSYMKPNVAFDPFLQSSQSLGQGKLQLLSFLKRFEPDSFVRTWKEFLASIDLEGLVRASSLLATLDEATFSEVMDILRAVHPEVGMLSSAFAEQRREANII